MSTHSNRIVLVLDHWTPNATFAKLRTELLMLPADAVCTIKLSDYGWGYGHTLTGHIVEIAQPLTEGGRANLRIVLTEDSDRERIGYVTGDEVKVELDITDWVEHVSQS